MITEGYINIIGNSFSALKSKKEYADEVWDILNTAYASIGGLKGRGFSSKEDMIQNIPFWKIITDYEGDIKALMLYRDKQGRKMVSLATDGTSEGKSVLASMFRKEFSRAYCELSGPSLRFVEKTLGIEYLKSYAIPLKAVENILGKEVYPYTGNGIPKELEEFAYSRIINGEKHNKVMFGTIGKGIE